MNVLITGFLGSDEQKNASGELVASLMERLPQNLLELSSQLRFELIETDGISPEACQKHLQTQLQSIAAKHDPRICLFIGQAPTYNRIRIERFATNLFLGKPIGLELPPAYSANLPALEEIPSVLNKHNIPAGLSNYAGQHTCNLILYSMLHMIAAEGLDCSAGFVHVPVLPEQVANAKEFPLRDSPSMTIELLREAMVHTIKCVVEKKR